MSCVCFWHLKLVDFGLGFKVNLWFRVFKESAGAGRVPVEHCIERPLFGGSISSSFPPTFQVTTFSPTQLYFSPSLFLVYAVISVFYLFQDVSTIREVPDNQARFSSGSVPKYLHICLLYGCCAAVEHWFNFVGSLCRSFSWWKFDNWTSWIEAWHWW